MIFIVEGCLRNKRYFDISEFELHGLECIGKRQRKSTLTQTLGVQGPSQPEYQRVSNTYGNNPVRIDKVIDIAEVRDICIVESICIAIALYIHVFLTLIHGLCTSIYTAVC